MSHHAIKYHTFYFHKFKVIGLNYNDIISVMIVDDWYNLTNYCLNNGSWLGLKLKPMIFYMRRARRLNTFSFVIHYDGLQVIINIALKGIGSFLFQDHLSRKE